MKVHRTYAVSGNVHEQRTATRAWGCTVLIAGFVLLLAGNAKGQDVECPANFNTDQVRWASHYAKCESCRRHRRPCQNKHCPHCYPELNYPEAEGVEPAPTDEPVTPEATPREVEPEDSFDAFDSTSGLASSFGGATGPQSAAPLMIGDYIGDGYQLEFPNEDNMMMMPPGEVSEIDFTNPCVVRTFKIAENQSAVPQDRIIARYDYFNDLGGMNSQLHRYVVGFEKTFCDARASIEMILPYYTAVPGRIGSLATAGPNSTPVGTFGGGLGAESDVGDLTTVFKYALWSNRETGRIIASGLAVTAPTGPDTLGDIDPVFRCNVNHDGAIQPFLGFLCLAPGGFFAQGFTAVDVPFDGDDATLWFNDLGIGCYRRRPRANFLTAIIPTVELHHSSPLNNHLMTFTPTEAFQSQFPGVSIGQAEYVDQLNLTAGLTLGICGQTSLGLGFVKPLVGPNPYNYEIQVQFNVFPAGFGRLVGGPGAVVPFF